MDRLNNDFVNVMGELIKQLNEAIAEAIGAGRVELSYQPVSGDPFGVMGIEHFDCETFSLEFVYSIARASGDAFTFAVRYTNEPIDNGTPFDGVIFMNLRNDNQETRIPTFACSVRNQCDGTKYQLVCKGRRPAVKIDVKEVDSLTLTLSGTASEAATKTIIAWVWDIPDTEQVVYLGQEITVRRRSSEQQLTVQLTAITELGCVGIIQISV